MPTQLGSGEGRLVRRRIDLEHQLALFDVGALRVRALEQQARYAGAHVGATVGGKASDQVLVSGTFCGWASTTPTVGVGIWGGPCSLPQAASASRLRHSTGVRIDVDFMRTP